ncbi:ABC transporter permease [Acidobacteria bacterium AH-259-A15]|nr:ABC transporter permease [Acidobacteria bacterium AH-259-A15]
MILRIAWRNLWRRTRRTLLTVSTVSLGLALLLISLGLGDGSHQQMIDSAVRMGVGHLVIQQTGYQEGAEIDRTLAPSQVIDAESWIEEQRSRFPIRDRLRRVFASGLASSADGSTGAQIIGIQPEREMRASLFDEKLIQGRFLHEEGVDQVVLGEGMARKLKLELGEKMVLMAQAAYTSEIESKLVRVTGIIRTGLEQFDQMLVLMHLDTAQEFLGLGTSVHQVAIFLEDELLSEALAALGKKELPELEVLHWGEALPELRDYIRVDDGGNYVFHVFIFLLIAFTVMNTLLMSVLERSREFALLDALGLAPGKRFAMVLVEGTLVALLSALVGGLLGYSGHLYLHVHGLPIDAFYSGDISAAGVTLDPVLYSDLSFNRIAGSVSLVMILTLLLALLPALRAARAGNVHLLGNV